MEAQPPDTLNVASVVALLPFVLMINQALMVMRATLINLNVNCAGPMKLDQAALAD